MKIKDRINLIPRNNWDYGLQECLTALTTREIDIQKISNTEKYFQAKPIWVTSGRAALYAILKAMHLPANAKIGVPLFCCSVVFEAIHQAGLIPQFIDVNLDDANMSVDDLRKKIGELDAIVAVHMFGKACDIDEIKMVSGDIPVIEDCAQSIFSTYKGRKTGLLSEVSFFSFRSGKYISVGEGAAIFCQDEKIHHEIKSIVGSYESWPFLKTRIDAISTLIKSSLYKRPLYGLVGYPVGMRLDKALNLTAKDGFSTGQIAPTHQALIEKRMPEFYEKIKVQIENANLLHQKLKPAGYLLPENCSDCGSNWFQFALKFENKELRDSMADRLFEYGIDTARYLNEIADEAREKYGYQGDCPNAERLAETVLLIPIHYQLNSNDIDRIAQRINTISLKL